MVSIFTDLQSKWGHHFFWWPSAVWTDLLLRAALARNLVYVTSLSAQSTWWWIAPRSLWQQLLRAIGHVYFSHGRPVEMFRPPPGSGRSWLSCMLRFTWTSSADSNYKVHMWVCVCVCLCSSHAGLLNCIYSITSYQGAFFHINKEGRGVTQVCFLGM